MITEWRTFYFDITFAVCDKCEALNWPNVLTYYPFVEFLPLVAKRRSFFTRQSSCQATKKRKKKKETMIKGLRLAVSELKGLKETLTTLLLGGKITVSALEALPVEAS